MGIQLTEPAATSFVPTSAAKHSFRVGGQVQRGPDATSSMMWICTADPRASIAAATLSDPTLFELLTRRLRETNVVDELGQRVMSVEPIFDVEDIRVLAVTLALLAERNPVVISAAHGGTWPAWSDLPRTTDLLERLRHLAANNWLSISSDGSDRSVTYGPAALRAAQEAGVDVAAA
jgi:hypothetical protein